jgi:diguanylate cyclase (GGDEF)-like protein
MFHSGSGDAMFDEVLPPPTPCPICGRPDSSDVLREAQILRHQAALDRTAAARDRHFAALSRSQASLDREMANQERACTGIDELTGALERTNGTAALRRELDRSLRANCPLVIGFFDVDGLKRTNDTYGHAAGDDLLRSAGFRLRTLLRSYDVIVRYGGDEFVCSLADTDVKSAASRFEALRSSVTVRLNGGSVTAGFAQLRTGETLEEVIARADAAMYANRKRMRMVDTRATSNHLLLSEDDTHSNSISPCV